MPPDAKVNPWQEIVTAPGLSVDPVKFICLNEPENVGTNAPDVRFMLSLFDVVAPAVLPKLNALALTDIAAEIFEVPVNVKFLASDINNTVVLEVVVRTIDPVLPNAMERVLLLVD